MPIHADAVKPDTLTPVSEYDVSAVEGVCVPYDYAKTLQQFRDLINNPDNGIPDKVREQLAGIYTITGTHLSDFIPVVTMNYDIESVDTQLNHILTSDFDVDEDDVDKVKQFAGVTPAALKELLKEASARTSNDDYLAGMVSDTFFEKVTEVVMDFVHEQAENGMISLPEHESRDFDLS